MWTGVKSSCLCTDVDMGTPRGERGLRETGRRGLTQILHVNQITSENLLYSTGKAAQWSMGHNWEGDPKRGGIYIYTHG